MKKPSPERCDKYPCNGQCQSDRYYTDYIGESIPCPTPLCDYTCSGPTCQNIVPKCTDGNRRPPPPQTGEYCIEQTRCSERGGQCTDGQIPARHWTCYDWKFKAPRPIMNENDKVACCGRHEMRREGVCDCGWCGGTDSCNGFMTEICSRPLPNGWLGVHQSACDSYAIDNNGTELLSRFIRTNLGCHPPPSPGQSTDPTTQPGSCKYAPQSSLFLKLKEYCTLYPGVCDEQLIGLCSQYTRADLDEATRRGDPLLQQICGCYLPDKEYPYSKRIVNKCDPMCLYQAVQRGKIDKKTRQKLPDKCEDSACVIDDIVVNMVDSPGFQPSFDVLCKNCSPGTKCNCYFGKIQLNNYGKLKDAGIDFDVSCDNCWILGEDGNVKPILCSDLDDYYNKRGIEPKPLSPSHKKIPVGPTSKTNWIVWILLGAVALFIGVMMLG